MIETIATDRLLLTPVSKQDAEELHHLWMHPLVRRYLFDDKVLPLSETEAFIAKSLEFSQTEHNELWLARLKNSPTIVGFGGYWTFFDPPEVQLIYGLSNDYWGQGLATEMASAMVQYGFETHQFDVIRASTNSPNVASIAVMKRLGMAYEKQATIDGQDLIFYRLNRDRYSKGR
ncbi:GNAT family N-acetyltransferase [Phormidium tenue FACHB-886]|nr:GNAT family N-acetyltransferase [Phormidium tenue FACHB-886]